MTISCIWISHYLKNAGCHEIEKSDDVELAQIIRSHGSAKQWCSFLKLDEDTCNVLDHYSQHPDNAVLDVVKKYWNQKLNSCWEHIIDILCNKLNDQRAASELSEKHGVDFSSQCS